MAGGAQGGAGQALAEGGEGAVDAAAEAFYRGLFGGLVLGSEVDLVAVRGDAGEG